MPSGCARTAQSRNSLSIPSTLLTVLGLLAMRRVVSPIIDRVPTFVHRLYGRYPVRAVLAPMAPDFPDHDPEPTILDRFPIRCQARCKPCEKPCFQAVSGLNKVNECIDQPLIAPRLDLSGESPFAVRPVGQWHHLACHDLVPIHLHAPYLRCIEKEGHLFPDAPSTP